MISQSHGLWGAWTIFSSRVFNLKLMQHQSCQSNCQCQNTSLSTTPRLESEKSKRRHRPHAPFSRSQHLLGMERRFTQGDRDGPGAAWHRPTSLNECSESHSAWRNSPWPWMPAPWHTLTYIFTQLLFLRTETKKNAEPHCSAALHEGLKGVCRVLPEPVSWARWKSLPLYGNLCGACAPSPLPHPQTLLIFPDSLRSRVGFQCLFTKGREKLAEIKWPKITSSEECLRRKTAQNTRVGLSLCLLWEEKMKRKLVPSGRQESYKINRTGFQRKSQRKGEKFGVSVVWWHPGQTWIQILALSLGSSVTKDKVFTSPNHNFLKKWGSSFRPSLTNQCGEN